MMTMNRLEEMQVQDEKLDTAMALSEIRTQLQELTKSVESCQTEVNNYFYYYYVSLFHSLTHNNYFLHNALHKRENKDKKNRKQSGFIYKREGRQMINCPPANPKIN